MDFEHFPGGFAPVFDSFAPLLGIFDYFPWDLTISQVFLHLYFPFVSATPLFFSFSRFDHFPAAFEHFPGRFAPVFNSFAPILGIFDYFPWDLTISQIYLHLYFPFVSATPLFFSFSQFDHFPAAFDHFPGGFAPVFDSFAPLLGIFDYFP
ncbi:hypothetical protein J2S13_003046 [Oikeobacillus pervagus]|uniref:Uncharacterized protein n=1 Tax=Oikeobacillus pervagus TaxID=1325931 RepID=A0AAJ1T1F5_9BACI|nr:hypothetical protein [Oikeobacillus pervagus]MDQ0216584.1 hypothetical protein [Oikeobacillus pervagus]